jgi:murein DD-endopeptidase MepM/ murein hydrolase activator NlpD
VTDPVLRIILVPATSQSRTYEVSYKRLRVLRGFGMVLGTVVVFMIGTWTYMASRVSHMVELEAEVALMRAERERIPGLRRRLSTVERQYEDIRDLFAPNASGAPSELWLPPPGSLSRSSGGDEGHDGRPDSWPLVERGFVTQGRFDDVGGVHSGVDIAIPTGSYIRASGAGRVVEVREDDPTFGKYVRIDHENGYETLYAHASEISVELGEEVRKNEVIALSGSTGESTAPHLHFEIRFEGETVDPLELVEEP